MEYFVRILAFPCIKQGEREVGAPHGKWWNLLWGVLSLEKPAP